MNSAGDMREAFEAYRAHPSRDLLLRVLEQSQGTVYNLCYQVLRHAQEAEDAAQQVFLQILDRLGGLPDGPRFHAWVPTLTESVKIPNSCNSCHADKTAAWALEALRSWPEFSAWRVAR